MSPNPLLVKSYRHEYETTDISEYQLRAKYKLPADFDMSQWKKNHAPDIPGAPDLPATITPSEIVTDDPDEQEETQDEYQEHKVKIKEFKVLALDHALNFMRNDSEYAEVKEFKDMVSVVDSIDKSLQRPTEDKGTTVNVLIQNIMREFKDDC